MGVMMMSNVRVHFNPCFRETNESKLRYVIMKGSAGSGKSVNVAQDFILKLSDMRYKGANLLCVRKIDESNRDSTFAELKKAIYTIFGSKWPRYWSVRESPMRLTCNVTKNTIIFRGMKDDKQREKVKSITADEGKITWIWVEEATELTEDDFDILDDRLRGRLDNPNLFYQIKATFNPVSSTHWLKGKFFDIPNANVLTHSSNFHYNLFIDEQYKQRMEMDKERNPEHYRVYALGDWGMLGGQFFNGWKESVHVVKPFKIPDSWTRFRMMDWGSYHPYACLWGAADYDGTIYIYRELYGYGGKANVGTKESSRAVAQKILAAEANDYKLIGYGVLDSACWGRQDTGNPSVAEEINKVLMSANHRPFNPSQKDREQGGEEIKLRLEGYTDLEGKQHPGVFVFNNCFHLIRTLPELTHDKNQPEKYDTNGEDHCFVAGTMISTSRGDVPIEKVTTDDYVMTRKGYRRVIAAGLTRKNADVFTMCCENGKTLTGTGNHPIFVKEKGFIPLDTIRYGHIIYTRGDMICQENRQTQQTVSYLMELRSGDIQKQRGLRNVNTIEQTVGLGKKEYPIFTDMCGNIITGLFQMVITCTIKMKTHLITALKTLSCYLEELICNFMRKSILGTKNFCHGSKKTLTDKEKRLLSGTKVRAEENGIESTELKSLQESLKSLKQRLYAKCAENNMYSQTYLLLEEEQGSVHELVEQDTEGNQELTTSKKSVLSVEKSTKPINTKVQRLAVNSVVLSCQKELKKADVYNLTIDEVHEYFANGFLVHNCTDALAYGFLSRPYAPSPPKKKDAWMVDGWVEKPADPSPWGY